MPVTEKARARSLVRTSLESLAAEGQDRSGTHQRPRDEARAGRPRSDRVPRAPGGSSAQGGVRRRSARARRASHPPRDAGRHGAGHGGDAARPRDRGRDAQRVRHPPRESAGDEHDAWLRPGGRRGARRRLPVDEGRNGDPLPSFARGARRARGGDRLSARDLLVGHPRPRRPAHGCGPQPALRLPGDGGDASLPRPHRERGVHSERDRARARPGPHRGDGGSGTGRERRRHLRGSTWWTTRWSPPPGSYWTSPPRSRPAPARAGRGASGGRNDEGDA